MLRNKYLHNMSHADNTDSMTSTIFYWKHVGRHNELSFAIFYIFSGERQISALRHLELSISLLLIAANCTDQVFMRPHVYSNKVIPRKYFARYQYVSGFMLLVIW